MIEILGVSKGKEYEAAMHLRSLILTAWPDMGQNKKDIIKIFVGLKLYSYGIEDIDLLVIGHLSEPRDFSVEYKFHPRSGEFSPRTASIKNFLFVIETKSHDAKGIKFTDKIAKVRYIRDGNEVWEDVSEKNREQMFCFKNYLSDHGVSDIYLQNLVYLSGLREESLPARPHNFFGSNASFERILNILGQISSPKRSGNSATISFGSDENFKLLVSSSFSLLQIMQPTPIDRMRMDRIAKAGLSDDLLKDIGNRQLTLRGRGGTGKTVMLLQMAYRKYDENSTRSLVLTYNRALVADMRRTMALMGVPRSVENGGICVDTVHSFIGRLMINLSIIEDYEEFLKLYEDNKNTLLEYLKSNTISKDDLATLVNENAVDFAWDCVFVDEGQDWPSNEIEILKIIYGPEKIIIADGVDQYVRDSVADWTTGVSKESLRTKKLNRCLRMKANLANFVSDFAKALDLKEWDLEANIEANGGRVLIVEGDLARNNEIYDQLASEAFELGNYPVDMLACVPPTLVIHDRNEIFSLPGTTIVNAGGKVWDACSFDVRQNYPKDKEALRIVQYDSCRGLEGWTVVNYNYDDFWNYKMDQGRSLPPEDFMNEEDLASNYAARWAMIPLTRAMDTLVINVSKNDGKIKDILKVIALSRSDFVEWIKLK